MVFPSLSFDFCPLHKLSKLGSVKEKDGRIRIILSTQKIFYALPFHCNELQKKQVGNS